MEQSRSDVWGYKYPKKSNETKKIVHCRLLYAKNILETSRDELCLNYGNTATAILRKHDLGFAMSEDDAPIDFNRLVDINDIAQQIDDFNEIRSGIDLRWRQATPSLPSNGSIIPIVLVKCKEKTGANEAWRGKFVEYPQPPESPDASRNFILLDAEHPNRTDWATLIHEVGHAAGMKMHAVVGPSPSPPFDIMCTVEDQNFPKNGIRDGMLKRTVDQIGGAIFSW